jgi:hypothetical protein
VQRRREGGRKDGRREEEGKKDGIWTMTDEG